jgi:hypothetical protein
MKNRVLRGMFACGCLLFGMTALTACKSKADQEVTVVLTETTAAPTTSAPAETEAPVSETETTASEPSTAYTQKDDSLGVISGTTVMDIITVTGEDLDENQAAFYPCTLSGTYYFQADSSDEVVWNVYILDQAPDENTPAQIAKETPALTGDGKLVVKKGQYVYIQAETASEEISSHAAYRFGVEVITK